MIPRPETRLQRIVKVLSGTMQINPDDFSPITSKSRTASLSYALAGWLYMLRYQKNIRIQVVATVIIMGMALWLQVDLTGLALLILIITVVWVAEFMNAAVEAAINTATQELHPMAKVGKDVAAAAVLISAVASVLIGLLILGPPLLHRLGF